MSRAATDAGLAVRVSAGDGSSRPARRFTTQGPLGAKPQLSDVHVPFGVSKASGFGPHEPGRAAIEFYTEEVTVYQDV